MENKDELIKTKFASQILDDNFSFMQASGGLLGILGSVLPSLIFVITYLILHTFLLPIVFAVSSSIVLGALSFIYKKPISQIFFGIIGVVICSWWVYQTGRAENFFVLGLITNAVYLFVMLVSILVRIPLIGLLVELISSSPLLWRKNPRKYSVYRNVTWVWVGMFALRLGVKLPLYLSENVAWLATAHIILSVPLYVLVVYISWVMIKPILKL